MDGEDQPAASQMSEMDTPLDHVQEEAMPLVEWVLTLMGHCTPKEEYAKVIASTNHPKIICFVTGPPLARLPNSRQAGLTERACRSPTRLTDASLNSRAVLTRVV